MMSAMPATLALLLAFGLLSLPSASPSSPSSAAADGAAAPRLRAARRLDDGVWTPPPPPTLAPLPTIAPIAPQPWQAAEAEASKSSEDDEQRFDCDKDFVVWVSQWSSEKKAWCCKKMDRGCDGSDDSEKDKGGDKEYDCKADHERQMHDWSESRKAWCCAHKEVGCDELFEGKHDADSHGKKESKDDKDSKKEDKAKADSDKKDEREEKKEKKDKETKTSTKTVTSTETSTSTVTTTITQTTTSTNTCSEECVIDGSAKTCTDHIQESSLTDYLGDPDSCGLAQRVVAKQCPVCGGCPAHEAGCGILELPPTQPPTTSLLPSQTPCDSVCTLGGQPASCKARMLWVADNIYQANKDSCTQAHKLVLNQCHEVCSFCTIEDTGCVDPEMKEAEEVSFDCDEDPKDSSRWSAAKKSWCCKHMDKGCEFVTDAEGFKKKFDDTLGPQFVNRATGGSSAAAAAARIGIPSLFMMMAAVVGVTLGRRAFGATRARPDRSYFGLGDPPREPLAAFD